jgi:transposase-like protein
MNHTRDENEPMQRPEACPFCHSKAIGTLAKVVTRSTFWRCQACGEGWNARELATTNDGRLNRKRQRDPY